LGWFLPYFRKILPGKKGTWLFHSKIEPCMLKIINTVENYYYRWDLKGEVPF
jgi:hypothetical protein